MLFGDVVAARARSSSCSSAMPSALVLTMDDPVLVDAAGAARARLAFPDLPIIARARDTAHAAELYKAGATDAVPETLEASLQLSEAVLVDLGVAMGPVIASIHEKRDELRARDQGRGGAGRGAAARPAPASATLSLRRGLEAEHARDIGLVLGIVGRMPVAVEDDDLAKSNGDTPSRQATLTPSWFGFERRLWCV